MILTEERILDMVHQLWGFGSNGEGQLGEGIPVAYIIDKPTLLPSQSFIQSIKSVKSGDNHTLFLLAPYAISPISSFLFYY